MKNCVAEGIASDVNDFTFQASVKKCRYKEKYNTESEEKIAIFNSELF